MISEIVAEVETSHGHGGKVETLDVGGGRVGTLDYVAEGWNWKANEVYHGKWDVQEKEILATFFRMDNSTLGI